MTSTSRTSLSAYDAGHDARSLNRGGQGRAPAGQGRVWVSAVPPSCRHTSKLDVLPLFRDGVNTVSTKDDTITRRLQLMCHLPPQSPVTARIRCALSINSCFRWLRVMNSECSRLLLPLSHFLSPFSLEFLFLHITDSLSD